ncbi:MAG: M50 family metallopeptidase [Bacteroidota bacterium]
MKEFFQDKDVLFYMMLISAIIIIRVPVIGKYFRVFNTLIHENAHAVMALLLNGSIKRMELFSDLSGSATTTTKSKFATIIVSFVGYPAASFSSLLMLFLIQKHFYTELLIGILFLSVISLIFFVRNKYGIIWLMIFIVLNSLMYYSDSDILIFLFLLFLSFIVLAESTVSSVELFFIALKNSSKAGDATNLKKSTHIPAIIWCFLFVVISAYVLYLAVSIYFPYLNKLC